MGEPDRTSDFASADAGPGAGDASLPLRIGRYRIERVLGEGGFGRVYLARDDQLQRHVAIKVPHPGLVATAADAETYLAEARAVAGLDHPNIVPVYDVGGTDRFPCYVVSRYIDGSDLRERLRQSRPSAAEAADLAATVADALNHAHRHGIVHRDVKPGNILVDRLGRPFVGDFGLALRDQDQGRGPRYAGTPAYMSPEQARGEGHRVDGRSDVFSLGVVLYELLTGRRPFQADSVDDLLQRIARDDPRPPRQIDDSVPKELDRICLRAISKRAADRYSTARDLADDLRHFVAGASESGKSAETAPPRREAEFRPPEPPPARAVPDDSRPARVVPKGLRSFDSEDADFFLDLLPGPRDRDGLPDNIRVWKHRIEAADADRTFSVGLIYGPSGCGKSSLVKAGLIPRLSSAVTTVYVEATGPETEARLLKGLRRQVPGLPDTLGLSQSLAAVRRGRHLPPGHKVLVVLDQFEQWLHARRDGDGAELVQALRQCDGEHLQAVVLVRDDFWLAVSRFMQSLEVVIDGENSRLVDLFDLGHARKVLAAFGRAYGRLPEGPGQTAKDQDAFVDQVIAGLAREDKVIPVRLALFAELVKGRPWTPAALKAFGGTEGVGVTFLNETFAASTAPPPHRLHQKAAQAVLKALLPAAGTDIRGHMQSRQELLDASGYAGRPADFEALLRILDGDLRLISPTDPEGKDDGAGGGTRTPDARYYQLTHDYLVPAVREWLTRKQKETRRGRAELLLSDRAAVWAARPEPRQLPSLLQWGQLRWLTARAAWTPAQRRMMAKAARHHAVWAAAAAAALALVAVVGVAVRGQEVERRKATHAAGLVRRLVDADTAQVPGVVGEMAAYRPWVDPLLQAEADAAGGSARQRQRLHLSLARLPTDASQVDYLFERLLDSQPPQMPVIRDALEPYGGGLAGRLWAVVREEPGTAARRLRALAALARYDPASDRWSAAGRAAATDLMQENAIYLGTWADAFRPVKDSLVGPLTDLFRDRGPDRTGERNLATNLLADYVADDLPALAELLLDADERQFGVVYPRVAAHGEAALHRMTAEIGRAPPAGLPASDDQRERLAKRQANAAAVLIRSGRADAAWPLLRHSADPRLRSYLIHRLGPSGARAGDLLGRLEAEPDVSARRALLLSLGEFPLTTLSPTARADLVPRLQEIYRTDPDPGLHGASEWLLGRWAEGDWVRQQTERWAGDRAWRERRLAEFAQEPAKDPGPRPPRWYVNSQGQAMVVLPGPVEFQMGSPDSEVGRVDHESLHRRRIGRSFAVASKPVTRAQYRALFPDEPAVRERPDRHPELPAVGINWFMAARYCNLLSEHDGIDESQWCYEIDERGPGARLKTGYLGLSGYRLPTEAEMEYATRAGAVTSRFYGETDELLGSYAWYARNSDLSFQRVGLKKPNDFGLFDALGTCFTWCLDGYASYPTTDREQVVDDGEIRSWAKTQSPDRVLRGGSFADRTAILRSASRVFWDPAGRSDTNGLRPARSLSAAAPDALRPVAPENGAGQ